MPSPITSTENNKCGSQFDFFKIQKGKMYYKVTKKKKKNTFLTLDRQMERGEEEVRPKRIM